LKSLATDTPLKLSERVLGSYVSEFEQNSEKEGIVLEGENIL